jgi:hypothetical protein
MGELIKEIYPLTSKEVQYLKSNPKELDKYSQNYNNRYSKQS